MWVVAIERYQGKSALMSYAFVQSIQTTKAAIDYSALPQDGSSFRKSNILGMLR